MPASFNARTFVEAIMSDVESEDMKQDIMYILNMMLACNDKKALHNYRMDLAVSLPARRDMILEAYSGESRTRLLRTLNCIIRAVDCVARSIQ